MTQKRSMALYYLRNQSRLLSTEWCDLNPPFQPPLLGADRQAPMIPCTNIFSDFQSFSHCVEETLLPCLIIKLYLYFKVHHFPDILLNKLIFS